MSSPLRLNESVTIPADALQWRLPDDPSIGRADPTLGGFITKVSVNVNDCPGLLSPQRRSIRDRVPGWTREGDIILQNDDGVITVMVDHVVEYPTSARLARDRLATLLGSALPPQEPDPAS